MKLRELTPMLRTRDLQGSVDFYTTVLGFVCDAKADDWSWASVRHDFVSIMFALPNEHEPFEHPVFTGSLYINADDVEALWEQVKDRARICYPIEDFDYGMREFAIYDNNGYLLQFGRELPESLEAAEGA
jgi:catechol 2,3-dioxygenase-like lactoylglutathione lyase family enzyme